MAGTHDGGKEAAKTLKKRYGADYYEEIGEKGGQSQGKENNPRNFANLDKKELKKIAKEGGQHSHGGGNRR